MGAGSSVVLYTDGLVERPGVVIDDGIALLAEVVDGVGTDPEALCDHLLATLVPDGNAADDVALLALRNVPMTDTIRSEFEAAPEALAVDARAAAALAAVRRGRAIRRPPRS